MKGYRVGFNWVASVYALLCFISSSTAQAPKVPMVPSPQEFDRPFGKNDERSFLSPAKMYHPETWFHFIGGNVSKDGIRKDLEAIARAGFSGIQLFHGQFGGPWPGVEPQIACLSPSWDDAVRFTAEESRRLGLSFFMNNTPGWATSGGPWIKPSNAMRNLIWSRTDISGGSTLDRKLSIPEPSGEEWRDYRDITVLAFPTPAGDSGEPLLPTAIKSNTSFDWQPYFAGKAKEALYLPPAAADTPHWVEVSFDEDALVRSVEFPSIQTFNHAQSYEPGVKVTIQAILPDGQTKDILKVDMPQSNWQDNRPITLACSEIAGVRRYRIAIQNKYNMALTSLRLFSAARKNSWESEAAWTLRSILRTGQDPQQSPAAWVNSDEILDISDKMDKNGRLIWRAPPGNWTILRFGHVNAGKENGPAPKEGTGWETDKLAASGANAQFAGYIGRLSGKSGPLAGGLLKGMLIDSWECNTQSWTENMEQEFRRETSYSLRTWLPALLGYVIKDPETTGRFLTDWRKTLSALTANNFYGRMATLAHGQGLNVTYETAAGDVLPGDILEYFKFADVPMCEFWQPMSENFVGSLNFKPIKPTASAARMYGKPRVAAEAFTSFALTWDEHFELLREVANVNAEQGVSHFVFHTYTHNPQQPFLPPGTSFGAGIGTPFLRGQTWWSYMPDFTNYLSRCSYMLERGRPVSDVLWYLGDEINHKPDQNAVFPEGYKYDYCNPDVLLNRLTVKDGLWSTPEGIRYRILWLPDAPRMVPGTLEKIYAMVRAGATLVGAPPVGLATLSGGAAAQRRFEEAVRNIWGNTGTGVRKVGKGIVVSGMTLEKALAILKVQPDVQGGEALWTHRRTAGADWYFVSAPKGKGFSGELSFRTRGEVEWWDPVTGGVRPVVSRVVDGRTIVSLELERSNACFLVFRHGEEFSGRAERKEQTSKSAAVGSKSIFTIPISGSWNLRFPEGWGIQDSLTIQDLRPWKDLSLSSEGKAFSGTVTYSTGFRMDRVDDGVRYVLELGDVEMAASVMVNGKEVGKVLAPPYRVDLRNYLKAGKNTIQIDVTSTWFNRLVFDAGQAEGKRKTWVINGPDEKSALRPSGLMGPVRIEGFARMN